MPKPDCWGAASLAPSSVVAAGVDENWFNELHHKAAWHLISRVAEQGEVSEQSVVMASASDKAFTDNGGSAAVLTEMVDAAPTAGNHPYWLPKCREKVRLRRYYDLGVQMQQAVVNAGDVDAFADMAESRLFELRKFKEEAKGEHRTESFQRIIDLLEAAHKGTGVVGLPSGYTDLDKILCGFRGGALYTIVAVPAWGSTLAMNIAEALAVKADVPVAFFSLEMSEDELNQRMLGSYSSINLQRFINHDYDKAERKLAAASHGQEDACALNKAPVFINPRTDITINQLRAEARRFVKKGAKLVIVDYLQLVSAGKRSSGNRVQEVGEISRGLKKMALELDVLVIALAS